jgi:hypothetical protein
MSASQTLNKKNAHNFGAIAHIFTETVHNLYAQTGTQRPDRGFMPFRAALSQATTYIGNKKPPRQAIRSPGARHNAPKRGFRLSDNA